ncbi:hypothetical protein KJ656_01345 [bacterium]|nr:hypothetical protein [bacterium]
MDIKLKILECLKQAAGEDSQINYYIAHNKRNFDLPILELHHQLGINASKQWELFKSLIDLEKEGLRIDQDLTVLIGRAKK